MSSEDRRSPKRKTTSPFQRRLGGILVLLVFAGVALSALSRPPLPMQNVVYKCGGVGGWGSIKFHDLKAYGPNLYRGFVDLNNDNKKADLAFDPAKNPSGWEFVMPRDGFSCRDLRVQRGRMKSILDFNQCSDGIKRTCDFYF